MNKEKENKCMRCKKEVDKERDVCEECIDEVLNKNGGKNNA